MSFGDPPVTSRGSGASREHPIVTAKHQTSTQLINLASFLFIISSVRGCVLAVRHIFLDAPVVDRFRFRSIIARWRGERVRKKVTVAKDAERKSCCEHDK